MKALQITGIIFFSALLMMQAAAGFMLYLQQQNMRKEVKQKYLEGFVGDELILLAIPLQLEKSPNHQFQRIHDREFMYLGKMYDIVDQQQIEDITWYLVYPDIKETGIKKMLKALMADYDRESKQQHQTGIKLWVFTGNSNELFPFIEQQEFTLYDDYPVALHERPHQPQLRPPRIATSLQYC